MDGREEKGLRDWHGEEELLVGCRTYICPTQLKDMANIIGLDCPTYRLTAILVPFRK